MAPARFLMVKKGRLDERCCTSVRYTILGCLWWHLKFFSFVFFCCPQRCKYRTLLFVAWVILDKQSHVRLCPLKNCNFLHLLVHGWMLLASFGSIVCSCCASCVLSRHAFAVELTTMKCCALSTEILECRGVVKCCSRWILFAVFNVEKLALAKKQWSSVKAKSES